jgi:hypothetical protein
MRHLTTIAAAVAAGLALAACGSPGDGASIAAGPAASASPASCHALYEAWKHGPADVAGKALVAQFRAVAAAGKAADIPHLVTALKRAGTGAADLERHPMPHCADPRGYWPAILTRIRSAADNAGSGSGLGGLLLAMVPLKQVPGLLGKLAAELRRTVHLGTPLT